MANNNNAPVQLQYVTVDYASHRDALLQRVQSRWSLSWNDFLAGSFGRIFIDLMAWSMATMAYLINRAAAENFLSTMTLRESAVRLGGLVGYKLKNGSAASVMCEATLTAVQPNDVVLARGTTVSVAANGSNLVFQLSDDYVITAGNLTPVDIVLVVSPGVVGNGILNSYFTAVVGSSAIVLNDPGVDLSTLVSPGQTVTQIGPATGQSQYVIVSITTSPSGELPDTLLLDSPWSDTAGQVAVQIAEQRVTFSQGQPTSESFSSPSVATPNYSYVLAATPVVEGSVSVAVNGVVWPTVPTLANQDSEAAVVEVVTLPSGQVSVLFGDGVFGVSIPLNSTVQVSYVTGGGATGNIPVGSVNATITGTQSTGQQATIQITNTNAPGEGGADAESLQQARKNIPAHVSSNGRGVTLADIESLALGFNDQNYGSIAFARAIAGANNSLLEGNTVAVYVWVASTGGTLVAPSTGLITALTNYLATVAVGTDFVSVDSGNQSPAPVALRFMALAGYDVTAVTAAVTSAVNSMTTALTPGDPLVVASLIDSVSSVQGVASVQLATPIYDLSPANELTVFTPPSGAAINSISLSLVSDTIYQGSLGFYPLTPWCLTITVGGVQVLVIPDSAQGRARIIGDRTATGLAGYSTGLLADRPVVPVNVKDFYYATDVQQLYRADQLVATSPTLYWNPVSDGGSYIELSTGRVVLSFTGAAQVAAYSLTPVAGYSTNRTVNVYASYTGDVTSATRQLIRAAIRDFVANFAPGAPLYAVPVVNSSGQVTLSASSANIRDVILSIPGITGVTQVTLEFPSNGNNSVNVSTTQLIVPGVISLNGQIQ